MFAGHNENLLALLRATDVVPAAPLREATDESQRTGRPLADVLLARGWIDRPALLRAVAAGLGFDYRAELPASLPGDVAALLDARLAHAYGVAPLAVDEGVVAVAAADPFDARLGADLGFALERDVRVAVADPVQIAGLIRQHYGAAEQARAAAESAAPRAAEGEQPEVELAQLAGRTPVVRFVNLVLAQAIRDQASDIHFEPFEHEFKVRYRVDGALYEMSPPPNSLARAIVSRLKVLGALNIAEHRVPQDGRITLHVGGRAVDLRISTLPTQFGESVVLRVLDQSAVQLELSQLTMPASIEAAVRAIARRPNGIFLVTGPTGSGKTTTLYSCLKLLNSPERKILTVEDPVEYEIEGLMQVPVNYAAELTFARALRSLLRHDPDVVMVGEIRDVETAQIAIQAALTGHLVLSTLHTTDAAGTVTRLLDMGIEPFLLASTLEAVLAQRLVRRICPECRERAMPAAAALAAARISPDHLIGQPLFRGRGCAACTGTGFRGRVGIFELLQVSDAWRDLIAAGAPVGQLRQRAVEQGTVPLREAGLRRVFAGETTIEELLRYL
jgi:type IV pilus assembly protein PilB